MSEDKKPEIIELHKGKTDESIIESIYRQVKSGDIDGYLFCGFRKDGEIVTAKFNISLLEQQHLAAAMQMMTTIDTIKQI